MDEHRDDALAKALAGRVSRRQVLGSLLGLVLAGWGTRAAAQGDCGSFCSPTPDRDPGDCGPDCESPPIIDEAKKEKKGQRGKNKGKKGR